MSKGSGYDWLGRMPPHKRISGPRHDWPGMMAAQMYSRLYSCIALALPEKSHIAAHTWMVKWGMMLGLR
jgi:hypothetical protein